MTPSGPSDRPKLIIFVVGFHADDDGVRHNQTADEELRQASSVLSVELDRVELDRVERLIKGVLSWSNRMMLCLLTIYYSSTFLYSLNVHKPQTPQTLAADGIRWNSYLWRFMATQPLYYSTPTYLDTLDVLAHILWFSGRGARAIHLTIYYYLPVG